MNKHLYPYRRKILAFLIFNLLLSACAPKTNNKDVKSDNKGKDIDINSINVEAAKTIEEDCKSGYLPDTVSKETSASDQDSDSDNDNDNENNYDKMRFEYYDKIRKDDLFHPYYQCFIRLEDISDKDMPKWKDSVITLYEMFLKEFNYQSFKAELLEYTGEYNDELKFVDGYIEKEKRFLPGYSKIYETQTFDHEKYKATYLKAYSIIENTAKLLDNQISEGRNFNSEDFKVSSKDECINILLGNNYKKLYNIGDILTFGDPNYKLKYKVIGFINKGTKIISSNTLAEENELDNFIIVPHYIPSYEASNKTEAYNLKFQIATLLDGYIKIEEKDKISDELYEHYYDKIKSMAKKCELEDLIVLARIPVDFKMTDK
ncbi:hypothetical protein [uncultured Fenollaria sp.]|uniref:hypothetical protein n=1 Tax=uncultured Fenollaria sp. TaxID=1686315 RepID=UPI0025EE32A9|nr:hypothetical protein [uncultured Fenollaria sp.]